MRQAEKPVKRAGQAQREQEVKGVGDMAGEHAGVQASWLAGGRAGSTRFPGGDQVDGLPPEINTELRGKWWKSSATWARFSRCNFEFS